MSTNSSGSLRRNTILVGILGAIACGGAFALLHNRHHRAEIARATTRSASTHATAHASTTPTAAVVKHKKKKK
jgi:hypothetical protein